MAKYTEESAKNRIIRNGGSISGKQITIKRAGIKLLGTIDYLCKQHGYFFFIDRKEK